MRGPSVLASDNDADYGPAATPTPRRWLFALAAVAASFLAIAFLGPWHFPPGSPDPATAVEILDLADGSSISLVDGAEVAVQLTDHARTVTLERNQAVFNVATDPARPFVVRSGEVFAQALGTVYSVTRVGARGAQVSVTEGSVLVWADGKADQSIALVAGDQLTLDPDAPTPQARGAGQISLDNESIRAAAERFNRVNRTQIVVEDPAVGEVLIVGLFKADDPKHFAHAAALVARAQVVHEDGRIILRALGPDVTKN